MGKLNQVPYIPQECGYNRITTVHTEERLSISSTESLSSLSACTVDDLDTGLDNDPTGIQPFIATHIGIQLFTKTFAAFRF